MARITKELAAKIVKKLGAEILTGKKAHDLARVYHQGRLIVEFGLRRGSRKDLGHDHIPKDLSLTPREALLLGQCHLYKDDWLQRFSERRAH